MLSSSWISSAKLSSSSFRIVTITVWVWVWVGVGVGGCGHISDTCDVRTYFVSSGAAAQLVHSSIRTSMSRVKLCLLCGEPHTDPKLWNFDSHPNCQYWQDYFGSFKEAYDYVSPYGDSQKKRRRTGESIVGANSRDRLSAKATATATATANTI